MIPARDTFSEFFMWGPRQDPALQRPRLNKNLEIMFLAQKLAWLVWGKRNPNWATQQTQRDPEYLQMMSFIRQVRDNLDRMPTDQVYESLRKMYAKYGIPFNTSLRVTRPSGLTGYGEDAPATISEENVKEIPIPANVMIPILVGGGLVVLGFAGFMAYMKYKTYELAAKHGGWQGVAALGGADAISSVAGAVGRLRHNRRRRRRR